uniref:Uncharacterized protein n=1 Tax=Bactrocera dorsalis TaxID=27457 RepID=A0A034WLI2_BACDO
MLPSKLKSKVWGFFYKKFRYFRHMQTQQTRNKNLKTSGNTSNLRCNVDNVHKKVLLDQVDKAERSSKTTSHSEPKQRKISEIINISPTAGTTASSELSNNST